MKALHILFSYIFLEQDSLTVFITNLECNWGRAIKFWHNKFFTRLVGRYNYFSFMGWDVMIKNKFTIIKTPFSFKFIPFYFFFIIIFCIFVFSKISRSILVIKMSWKQIIVWFYWTMYFCWSILFIIYFEKLLLWEWYNC